MAFDFSTLNDKDLEELARDILSKTTGLEFQSFKTGRDNGIDLRYSTINSENEIIAQVKHYLNSGISKLKNDLKKKEVSKVKKLNPKRYILVTSVPLSPKHKEDIKIIFSPFIISTSDILGKNDLNAFLRQHADIVSTHFKLWLTSTSVLKRIINNGIKGRSEFYEKKIKDKIKIFVPNTTHKLAVELLNKYSFILITGAPGIGKSTLAYMLTYQLLAEDFEMLYVREIKEAEELFFPSKKQVFLFDDFLGSITLDLHSSRNADSAIVQFIERVRDDKSKRLILTTRTTILNQAKLESDKIDNSKIEVSRQEIKFEAYRNIDKARILYNHVYFSNLSEELKSVFFENQFYWKVINHKHYNPRIIEFFTDIERLQPDVDYAKEVIEFLDNPSSIWEKPFAIQISRIARIFLGILFSLKGKYVIDENRFKKAFESRLQYEISSHNYAKKGHEFTTVVTELIGGFITKEVTIKDSHTNVEYNFLNPSIEDFLFIYFSGKNIDDYFDILKSSIYFEQFNWIATKIDSKSKKIFVDGTNYERLLQIFLDRIPHMKPNSYMADLEIVSLSIKLFKWNDIKNMVKTILADIELSYLAWHERTAIVEILAYIAKENLIDELEISLEKFFLALSEESPSYFQIEELSKLIDENSLYSDFIELNKTNNTKFYIEFVKQINNCWATNLDYFLGSSHYITKILERNKLEDLISERKRQAEVVNSLLRLPKMEIISNYKFDIDAQLEKNEQILNLEKTEIRALATNDAELNEPQAINRLFNSPDDLEPDALPF